MTEDEQGEIRAKMRRLLMEAAELGCQIDTTGAQFLYEAARGWNVCAETEIALGDFDIARERYNQWELDEEVDEDQQ